MRKDLLGQLGSVITLITAFLLPLWVVPLTINPFGFQKQYLFLALAGITTALWIIQTVRNKRILLSLSFINVSAILAMVVMAVSAFIIPNTAYQLSGRFILVASTAAFLLFGASVVKQLTWNKLLKTWLWSATLLSLLSLTQFTPWSLSKLLNQLLGTDFADGLVFSLAESPMAYLTFAVPVGLAGLVAVVRQSLKGSDAGQSRALELLKGYLPWSVITLASAAVSGVAVMLDENARPLILPFRYGWGIAVESFKQLPTFLVGFGPENFISAFHRFRDVSYNTTPHWDVLFNSSSSELLHTLTTTGVLGVAAWLLFFFALLSIVRKKLVNNPSLLVFVLIQLGLFLFLPFSVLNWAVLAITAIAVMAELRHQKTDAVKDVVVMLSAIRIVPEGGIKAVRTSAGFAYVISALIAFLGIFGFYLAGRVYAASAAYYLSLRSAVADDAITTYNRQQLAIRLNPVDPLYRRSYANTNLAIAQALSQQGEDLTEEDQNTLAQLIQQSIREARNAASLNPADTANWEVIAAVYSQLLDVEGADEWTNAALVQAIQTDPVAPGLRLSLAGLYRQLNQPVQAQRIIEQAIELKPDWANSYFNYGDILEVQQEYYLAYQSYLRTRELLPQDSPDREVVQAKIDELRPQAEEQFQQMQAEAQAAQEAAQQGQGIPSPEQPTLPEDEVQLENPPEGFNEILEGEGAGENTQPNNESETQVESPQPSPEEAIVLPEEVDL